MPPANFDHKGFSAKLQRELEGLFHELRSGMSAREDSRAFGAMVEKRIYRQLENNLHEPSSGSFGTSGKKNDF